jgi:glycosyltransferase involved in cell wall biosynthesis
MPRVSIGLPVYNGAKYLQEAIDSILSQTYPHFELIISDNASTDGTEAICRSYADQDDRVRYVRHHENRGAAWNFNFVVTTSKGEYFKWVAHDDIYDPDFLLKCIIALDQDPEAVMCFSRAIDIDETGKYMRRNDTNLDTSSIRPYRRFHDLLYRYHACYHIFGLIRLEALRKTRLIEPYVGSDRALLAELVLMGRFCQVQEMLFLHRQHPLRSTRITSSQDSISIWFDPRNRTSLNFPTWSLLVSYMRCVRKASVSWRQKVMCYTSIMMWIRKHTKMLFGDLTIAARKVILSFTHLHGNPIPLEDQEESNTGIVAFVPDPWETYWGTRHYIMSGLASRYKVLWVTPPVERKMAINKLVSGSINWGVKKTSPSLWVYTPEPFLPKIYKSQILDRFFAKLRSLRIRGLMSEMGASRIILYIWRPTFSYYKDLLPGSLVCYHVDDEYTFSPTELGMTEIETSLIQSSDIVFVHSKTLLDKKGHINPETYYVPNGVDFNLFQKKRQTTGAFTSDIDALPKPRIGYVGFIKEQIDLELILGIAQRRRNWSVVLVGPFNPTHKHIETDIKRLQAEPNIHFLGGKPRQNVPSYIMKLDVCLLCYKRTPYTNHIYPLKLHEYLACGKPVVATRLTNLEEFENVISFAEATDDWIDKIESAAKESNPKSVRKRIAIAAENSWNKRVDHISSILQTKMFTR